MHLSMYIIIFDSCSLVLPAVLQPVLLFAGASKAHALQVFRPYPVLPHCFTGISQEYWKIAFCSNKHFYRACPKGKLLEVTVDVW